MSDKSTAKTSLTIEVDAGFVQRVEDALRHLPPGWNQARLIEVGVVELLEQLERKYNKGRPFPATAAPESPQTQE